MSLATATLELHDRESPELRLSAGDCYLTKPTAWKRQASPADTSVSTEAPGKDLEALETLSELGDHDWDEESSDDEEAAIRVGLCVRRLVMQDAKFCPAPAAVASEESEGESEEAIRRLRLAARRWSMRGARRM